MPTTFTPSAQRNRRVRAAVALTALAIVGGTLTATATATSPAPTTAFGSAPASVSTVPTDSPAFASDVAFAREEERMARDLYAALAQVYGGAAPFANITISEQRHFDAVGRLLADHGIADPSAGLAPGSYADETIQQLYDGWLEQGSESLAAAYQVGIELETRDISDLEATIAAIDAADVDAVLGRLLDGSRHHLQAFSTAAAGGTGTGHGAGPGAGGGQRPGMGAGPGVANGSGMGPVSGGHGSGRGGGADCGSPDTCGMTP
jgi:hypothetical protein